MKTTGKIETLKVRVTKSSSTLFWYAKHIGATFSVRQSSCGDYEVIERGLDDTIYSIGKDDAEIITENTMKTTKEKIEVMQAFEDGQEIEVLFEQSWITWDRESLSDPSWTWGQNDYRIKPRTIQVNGIEVPEPRSYFKTENQVICNHADYESAKKHFDALSVVKK